MGSATIPAIHSTDTAELAKAVRSRLDLSQEGLARLVGASLRTVSRWELGREPDTRRKELLIRLKAVLDELPSHQNPRDIVRWLTSPQRQLEYCTPCELLWSEYGIKTLQRFIREQEESQLQQAVAAPA